MARLWGAMSPCLIYQICCMFIFWSKMTNFAFLMAHIQLPGEVRGLPGLHFEQWAFLYSQHSFQLSTVNFDYLGPLEAHNERCASFMPSLLLALLSLYLCSGTITISIFSKYELDVPNVDSKLYLAHIIKLDASPLSDTTFRNIQHYHIYTCRWSMFDIYRRDWA